MFTTTGSFLTLGGSASDNVGVTQITWANSRGGGGTASGTSVWTADVSGLQLGQNILTVTARDAANLTSSKSLTVVVTPVFTFTDDPLVARTTVVKAVHFSELREAVDLVRGILGLAPFAWTDPVLTPGSSLPRALHLSELRTALNQAYLAAGRPVPTYTDHSLEAGSTSIRAVHLNEVRAAVRAL
jgi:hypothetical protein